MHYVGYDYDYIVHIRWWLNLFSATIPMMMKIIAGKLHRNAKEYMSNIVKQIDRVIGCLLSYIICIYSYYLQSILVVH